MTARRCADRLRRLLGLPIPDPGPWPLDPNLPFDGQCLHRSEATGARCGKPIGHRGRHKPSSPRKQGQ